MVLTLGSTSLFSPANLEKSTRRVRKLQLRIAKAFREGKPGRVKALQRILTRSLAARTLAVQRVTTNKGKNAPGADRNLWKTPGEKTRNVQVLKRKGYTPLPLRRIYIPKKNGKLRPLSIPTMFDRAMQALYLLALIPIAEETADPNSYGFRSDRSTADAIEQCFILLSQRTSPRWILEGDIKSCFDTISRPWLLDHIPMDGRPPKVAGGGVHRPTNLLSLHGRNPARGHCFSDHGQYGPRRAGTDPQGSFSLQLSCPYREVCR